MCAEIKMYGAVLLRGVRRARNRVRLAHRRNEKPRPTWERGPGLSWQTAYVDHSGRMLGGSQGELRSSL